MSWRPKAGMSSGQRLVTSRSSTTTSRSMRLAPALRKSVASDGQDVRVRPLATPASTSIHGAWQIAPTGLPWSKKSRTKRTASGLVRSASGLATPPGRTRAS
jgi:hypothetical protein